MPDTTQVTFTLPCYQDRRGVPQDTGTFRNPTSIAEMATHCDTHSHIWFIGVKGDARRAKVNGKVRTWKRNPNRIEVPVKYGMYEYGTLTESDIERVLIPV